MFQHKIDFTWADREQYTMAMRGIQAIAHREAAVFDYNLQRERCVSEQMQRSVHTEV
jgi:hypothetical protein